MPWGDEWTDAQAKLVSVVFDAWWQRDYIWPRFEYVQAELLRDEIDAAELLRSFPSLGSRELTGRTYADVIFDHSYPRPPRDTRVALSVIGLARDHLGLQVADAFAAVLGLAGTTRKSAKIDPIAEAIVELTSSDVAQALPRHEHLLPAVFSVLREEWPSGVSVWEPNDGKGWRMRLEADAARFAGLDLGGYLNLMRTDYRVIGTVDGMSDELEPGWNQSDTIIRQLTKEFAG